MTPNLRTCRFSSDLKGPATSQGMIVIIHELLMRRPDINFSDGITTAVTAV